jgi:hypothetical protein
VGADEPAAGATGADGPETAHLAWSRGGTARLVALDGERVTVRSSTPSAPGSRPEGTLGDGQRFRMKVHRCKKDSQSSSEWFVLEGRLIDATKALRAALAALLPPSSLPSDR